MRRFRWALVLVLLGLGVLSIPTTLGWINRGGISQPVGTPAGTTLPTTTLPTTTAPTSIGEDLDWHNLHPGLNYTCIMGDFPNDFDVTPTEMGVGCPAQSVTVLSYCEAFPEDELDLSCRTVKWGTDWTPTFGGLSMRQGNP